MKNLLFAVLFLMAGSVFAAAPTPTKTPTRVPYPGPTPGYNSGLLLNNTYMDYLPGKNKTAIPVYIASTPTPTFTATPTSTSTFQAGSLTWTPTKTSTLTPTFTPIPVLYGSVPVASPTAVSVSTPRAGYITGMEIRTASNPGTVGDYFKVAKGLTAVFGPYIAPAGGQVGNLPQVFWDDGVSNLGFIPPTAATTFTYSVRWYYWPVATPVPTPFGLRSTLAGF